MSANKFTHESLYEVYLLLINKRTNMLLEKRLYSVQHENNETINTL